MPLIKPFRGLRPLNRSAGDVAAPPYDVLNSVEARTRAAGKPWSFLHISKPEIDLPADTDVYAPKVYAKGAENLNRMIAEGVLKRDAQPCYYAYRLIMGNHTQTGLVAAASVAAYDEGRIRRHEFTRPDKEDDRVRQIEALNAQTGPVLLAHPDSAEVDQLLAAVCNVTPAADVLADTGVRHTVWVIDDAATVARLSACFESMPALYIADGHHRSAAASRVAAARRANGSGGDSASANADYFLAVSFPAGEMQILCYNRVVRDLGGLARDAFLHRIEENFSLAAAPAAVEPATHGELGMYLTGQWYRLRIKPAKIPADPVGRLDVSLLSDQLLAPILGITDLRTDKRIDFVGGIRGTSELEKRVNSGEMTVAFSMHATSMADLMAVTDAKQVMPPKSTWFEPKLADGLVSHVLD
ncbi:MAG: DUF1015 domain-containing protein [Burkholderiales bacterium]